MRRGREGEDDVNSVEEMRKLNSRGALICQSQEPQGDQPAKTRHVETRATRGNHGVGSPPTQFEASKAWQTRRPVLGRSRLLYSSQAQRRVLPQDTSLCTCTLAPSCNPSAPSRPRIVVGWGLLRSDRPLFGSGKFRQARWRG